MRLKHIVTAWLVVGLGISGCASSGDSPGAVTSPAPSSAASAVGSASAASSVRDDAGPSTDAAAPPPGPESLVAGVRESVTELEKLSRAEDLTAGMRELASATVVNEIQAIRQELAASGLQQQGAATVDILDIAVTRSRNGVPRVVSALACVDMSGVSFVDEQGRPAAVTSGLRNPRVLHRYDLELRGDRWVVMTLDFPTQNECEGPCGGCGAQDKTNKE